MLTSVQSAGILDVYGPDEGFAMMAQAGLDGVDLNLDQLLSGHAITHGELNGFFDKSDDELREALRPCKEVAKRHGVRFIQAHATFPTWVNDARTNEYVLMAIQKTIMLCGYLECRHLVVHPCIIMDDPELERKENMLTYSALIPALREHGVVCCLENMFSRQRGKLTEAICSDPDEAVRYIDELNALAGEKLFGFCLDVGHATLLGKDIRRFIDALGDRLLITHVHDNNGFADEHLFPYMGITDWDRFCRALGENDYKGALSFETYNALATFDRALAPQLMSLLGATAKLLAGRVEEARASMAK